MLAASLSGALESVPGLRLYGPADPLRRTAIACFTVDGLDAAEIAHALDQRDIFCRPGLQCAPRAHRSLGSFPRGTVRFSLSSFNTEAEIEAAAGALREIVAEVRPGS